MKKKHTEKPNHSNYNHLYKFYDKRFLSKNFMHNFLVKFSINSKETSYNLYDYNIYNLK